MLDLHVSVKSDLINVSVSLGEYIEPFYIHVNISQVYIFPRSQPTTICQIEPTSNIDRVKEWSEHIFELGTLDSMFHIIYDL